MGCVMDVSHWGLISNILRGQPSRVEDIPALLLMIFSVRGTGNSVQFISLNELKVYYGQYCSSVTI